MAVYVSKQDGEQPGVVTRSFVPCDRHAQPSKQLRVYAFADAPIFFTLKWNYQQVVIIAHTSKYLKVLISILLYVYERRLLFVTMK